MDEDERFLEIDSQRHRIVPGEETPAADAELRIPLGGDDPADELCGRPHPAGILPPATTPAKPFAEDRPGRDETTLRLVEPAGEGAGLPGGPHADTDEGGEEIGRDGQARSLRNPVDRTDQLQAVALADDGGKHVGQRLPRSLDPRRHDPRGDDRRLQQPEVVTTEIEDLAQIGDVGRGVEVDARQPEQRLVDDSKEHLHRRPGPGIAPVDAQIDRHIEHSRRLGAIHPEEEDVAPAGMRQIHPDRRRFLEERERGHRPGRPAPEQLGADAERVVVGMADPEHPLVAADRPHRLPHLIGQRLQPQFAVGARQGARQSGGRPVGLLAREEDVDRLLETPTEEMVDGCGGDQPRRRGRLAEGRGELVAVDGGEKEQRPDAAVEIGTLAPEGIEGRRLGKQARRARAPAHLVDRAITRARVGRGDDFDEPAHGTCGCRARSSTICASTWERSRPERARAIWAVSRP